MIVPTRLSRDMTFMAVRVVNERAETLPLCGTVGELVRAVPPLAAHLRGIHDNVSIVLVRAQVLSAIVKADLDANEPDSSGALTIFLCPVVGLPWGDYAPAPLKRATRTENVLFIFGVLACLAIVALLAWIVANAVG